MQREKALCRKFSGNEAKNKTQTKESIKPTSVTQKGFARSIKHPARQTELRLLRGRSNEREKSKTCAMIAERSAETGHPARIT